MKKLITAFLLFFLSLTVSYAQNKKISELTEVDTLNGGHEFPVVYSGANYKANIAQVKDYVDHTTTHIAFKLNQADTLAPVAVKLYDETAGITYTWTRVSAGYFRCTATGGTPFTANKTFVNCSLADATTHAHFYATATSTTVITLKVTDTSDTLADQKLINALMVITIFP